MLGFFRGAARISAKLLTTFKNIPQGTVRNISLLPKSLHNCPALQPWLKFIETNLAEARFASTKSGKELVDFLTEEIQAEKKAQNIKTVPSSLDGFNVNLKGAEVELVKQLGAEKIILSFNINHTVDADDESPELDSGAGKPELSEMRSKPQFEVDVIRGNTTLSFTCSYLQGAPQEGEYNDVFAIDEICIYDGEWNDKVYAVAGDVLDGYLYDLLMNLLEEKGINNDFAEKLSDLSTAYEHASYITLLEGLSKFTSTPK